MKRSRVKACVKCARRRKRTFSSRIRSKTGDSARKMKSTRGKWGAPGLEVPRASPGLCFPVLGRSTIPTAYRSLGQPGFSLGFFCGVCISWLFPSQKCILAVTGLRPFPGPGEGGPPKANSTRCFLWCLLFLGRFPRKNQAWLSLRPIGSSWDDPGAPSHLCRIVVYSR